MTRRPRFLHAKSQRGFSLVELMTVVVIVGILSIAAIPAYQQYRIRSQMAEAVQTEGVLVKALRGYYLENGSFTSTGPNPAVVPGAAALGQKEIFLASTTWAELGNPIAPNSAMTFSYEVVAGQTPLGANPVGDPPFILPTADLNLQRSNQINCTTVNEHCPMVGITVTVSQCDAFGLSTAVDMGIQNGSGGGAAVATKNLSAYNWAVVSAVSNFSDGTPCTLLARTVSAQNGQIVATDLVTINEN